MTLLGLHEKAQKYKQPCRGDVGTRNDSDEQFQG